jgi:ammonia channel protein AmtB
LFGLGTLERSRFFSVSLTTIFLAGFLYPVVLHWVAPKVGWLNLFGYIDFAGSGYIHLFGATTALVVSFFLKERRDS